MKVYSCNLNKFCDFSKLCSFVEVCLKTQHKRHIVFINSKDCFLVSPMSIVRVHWLQHVNKYIKIVLDPLEDSLKMFLCGEAGMDVAARKIARLSWDNYPWYLHLENTLH